MTVSTSNILKSATAAGRPSARPSEKNLHIGKTLRDLYLNEKAPKTEGTFKTLLTMLAQAELRTADGQISH